MVLQPFFYNIRLPVLSGRLPALPDRAPTRRRKFKVEMPSASIDWEQMGWTQVALAAGL